MWLIVASLRKPMTLRRWNEKLCNEFSDCNAQTCMVADNSQFCYIDAVSP